VNIVGPSSSFSVQCESILRSLSEWFGIEESLLDYVCSTKHFPTFVMLEHDKVIAFLTLEQHFERSWEIHCMAVHRDVRGCGIGHALLEHVEQWLMEQGARFLQVKTLAATRSNEAYAQTRVFYTGAGFEPLEIFPELWSPDNPCLQLVKSLRHGR
jgi:N-acetylglutamate synthase-like GNAT family acetyltransferase